MHRIAVTPAHASPHSDDLAEPGGVVAHVIDGDESERQADERERPAQQRVEAAIADRGLVDEQQRHQRGGDEPGQAEHEHPPTGPRA